LYIIKKYYNIYILKRKWSAHRGLQISPVKEAKMKALVNVFISNPFLISSYLGVFYFAFQFGVIGKKKKIPVSYCFILAAVTIACVVMFFFLLPIALNRIGIAKSITSFINTILNKKINIYINAMLIINGCLALYLLLIDFRKTNVQSEQPTHRVINFILSLCVFLYICVGFLPVIPKASKATFDFAQLVLFSGMLTTLIVFLIWRPDKKRVWQNKIFISYRRKDTADVIGRIVDRLTAKYGNNNILRDVDSIPLGVNFSDYLDKLIETSAVCLVVIGKKWLSFCTQRSENSNADSIDFVQIEIATALAHHISIIPVLLQNASVPSKTQLPKSIQELSFQNGISIRPDPDFNMDIKRLIHGINAGIRKSKKMRKIYNYKKKTDTKTATKVTKKVVKKSAAKVKSRKK